MFIKASNANSGPGNIFWRKMFNATYDVHSPWQSHLQLKLPLHISKLLNFNPAGLWGGNDGNN